MYVERPKGQMLTNHCVKFSQADQAMYKRLQDLEPQTGDRDSASIDSYPYAASLIRDFYFCLNKAVPRIVPQEKVAYSYLLHHQLVEMLLKTKDFKELSLLTRRDEVNAKVGAVTCVNALLAMLEQTKDLAPILKWVRCRKELLGKMQQTQAKIRAEKLSLDSKVCQEKRKSKIEKLVLELKIMRSTINKHSEMISMLVMANYEMLQLVVAESVRHALDQICEVSSVLNAWGLTKAELKLMPVERKIVFVRYVHAMSQSIILASKIGFNEKRIAINHEFTGISCMA